MKELKPSLWRTCRVLAASSRLRLLRMLREEGAHTVCDLARRLDQLESTTSENARALNARGLICSRREGRYVFYTAEANPHVEDATEVLAAVLAAFRSGMSDEEIIHDCTAYTHERRITLVKALQERPLTAMELAVKSGVSPPATRRHLDKLIRRGLVERRDDTHRLVFPESPFARGLFLIALNS